MSLYRSQQIQPEQVQRPVVGMKPIPRETGGSVSEPRDKFPGLILVMCGFYGLLGAYLYATTLLEWILIPALSGALIVGGAVMMKRDYRHEEGSL